jgi:hypothetical protein
MTDAQGQDSVRYEQVLRALGAYLDGQGAWRITVLETPTGCTVRYHHRGTDEMALAEFGFSDLPDTSTARGLERPGGMAARYQDLLRALGHELDDEGAWNILLDELADGFLLTYQYVDPRHSWQPQKRTLILGADDQGMILSQAHARRAPLSDKGKGGLFSWLLG